MSDKRNGPEIHRLKPCWYLDFKFLKLRGHQKYIPKDTEI